MKLRVIHFVPDVAEAARFYEALGLQPEVRARAGMWMELTAAGGELDLHDAAIAADGEGRGGFAVNFVSGEPLEVVERHSRDAALARARSADHQQEPPCDLTVHDLAVPAGEVPGHVSLSSH
jgi:hypothetical protein